ADVAPAAAPVVASQRVREPAHPLARAREGAFEALEERLVLADQAQQGGEIARAPLAADVRVTATHVAAQGDGGPERRVAHRQVDRRGQRGTRRAELVHLAVLDHAQGAVLDSAEPREEHSLGERLQGPPTRRERRRVAKCARGGLSHSGSSIRRSAFARLASTDPTVHCRFAQRSTVMSDTRRVVGDLTVDANNLYREESYTDLKVAS